MTGLETGIDYKHGMENEEAYFLMWYPEFLGDVTGSNVTTNILSSTSVSGIDANTSEVVVRECVLYHRTCYAINFKCGNPQRSSRHYFCKTITSDYTFKLFCV